MGLGRTARSSAVRTTTATSSRAARARQNPATGSYWCQYPCSVDVNDTQCALGRCWSDFGTGDGLSGVCVDTTLVDAGIPDAMIDAPTTDAGVDAMTPKAWGNAQIIDTSSRMPESRR